ncbi:MAG: 2-octaprenyl-6-methoxyphenyl hydroxylase [Alphaproteobacteria bacterium MedPE-SWcel]|nr:MAG: 2-octaprenyl-6-methoxyphenyl hydroxylase [Alphaproteobacteria bacterium MedPE-SWcel]
MTDLRDIVIVGGGLNGPALALALAQAGHGVTLIDALPAATRQDDGFDGRSYALALASTRLLQQIGVWSHLDGHTQPMTEIKVSDGSAGQGAAPFFLHFEESDLDDGPMGYMVEDRVLRRALMTAMAETPGLTQISGRRVVSQSVSSNAVTVTLDDGSQVTGALLVGADGRQSGTAARAGIRRTGWNYGQTALVCAIAHDAPHHGIAHQFFMPPGPLAILPLPGNRCSIVWSESHAEAARIDAMDDAGYLAALHPRFGSFLGEISLAGKRYSYPLKLSLANSFFSDRLALVGDAAHGLHPIAGQGLNAGLRDIASLAEVLTDARRRGEDPASPLVLARYQQWRRFDTTSLALATDGFNRLFSNDNPILRAARDLGLGLTNAVPALRRGFVREAAGLSGDLPRLLQGRPL